MQYFNTTKGCARREGENLVLLEVPADALQEHLLAGELDALAHAPTSGHLALDDAEFLPPLTPARLIIIGLNYRAHADEVGMATPDQLMFVPAEVGDSLASGGGSIRLPSDYPDQVDYEAEIAVIIGRSAADVAADDAWNHIAGITAANDVTARDLQAIKFADLDFTSAKLLPTFKPLGPGVISTDEARLGLTVSSAVNGEIRQQATDADMLFSIPELVSILSDRLGLQPGDVILTGSPAGVGNAAGTFLRPGDQVEVTIGNLPPLRSTIEPA